MVGGGGGRGGGGESGGGVVKVKLSISNMKFTFAGF